MCYMWVPQALQDGAFHHPAGQGGCGPCAKAFVSTKQVVDTALEGAATNTIVEREQKPKETVLG